MDALYKSTFTLLYLEIRIVSEIHGPIADVEYFVRICDLTRNHNVELPTPLLVVRLKFSHANLTQQAVPDTGIATVLFCGPESRIFIGRHFVQVSVMVLNDRPGCMVLWVSCVLSGEGVPYISQ